ncbi:hsp70-binding protein 1 [Ceratina calcarata]|uniref:Hsp70-binding protein 1 n=1 Tax=Ceratina calcarata TaxID=156304 RepID=A0AAJ7JD38_9HYME|nr:hsp70-binding protein 1 [Ceratina calcarata]
MGAAHTSKIVNKMDNSQGSENSNKSEGQLRLNSSTRPLSIEGPSNMNTNEQRTTQPVPNQPRQPTNLQGLLRYAMEATNSQNTNESQFQPMDEERKEFLKQTLSSLSINIIEELQKSLKVLSNVVDLRPDDDTSEHEAALETIADYVDNIDIANDFYKIGGFSIFGPCLNSPHSGIRWRAAEVIAELAQNNPFCQDRILETGLFPTLLNMIDTDPAETVRIKALYAVSCIVREHPMSLKYMDINDGYSVLLRAMQSSLKKLQIKSAFLLSSLCTKEGVNDLKSTLVNMGLIEQAIGLLAMDDLLPEIRDQLLSILDALTTDDIPLALQECRRPELNFQSTLERYVKELKQEENPDQIVACNRILKKVFSDQDANQER